MKINYIFRHLDKSDFIRTFAEEHIEKTLMKLNPQADKMSGTVRLEMENSPQHPGKDVYRCDIHVKSKRHGDIIVKRRTANMYEAIAEATDRLSVLLSKVKGRFKSQRRMHKRSEPPARLVLTTPNL